MKCFISRYAQDIYHRLGFEDTAPEQNSDGIRFIPIVYKKSISIIALLVSMLEDKDTSQAYQALQKLEQIAEETDEIYPYIDKFIKMISSEKYVIRVRGFRLFCKQAKWDNKDILNDNIESALTILKDEKPTAVRQALTALEDVVRYKPEFRETIQKAVSEINYLQYKETMHSLIAKDIERLLDLCRI